MTFSDELTAFALMAIGFLGAGALFYIYWDWVNRFRSRISDEQQPQLLIAFLAILAILVVIMFTTNQPVVQRLADIALMVLMGAAFMQMLVQVVFFNRKPAPPPPTPPEQSAPPEPPPPPGTTTEEKIAELLKQNRR